MRRRSFIFAPLALLGAKLARRVRPALPPAPAPTTTIIMLGRDFALMSDVEQRDLMRRAIRG